MDTQILEDIGLKNSEIKVYMALLELGSASAGVIIDKSGLQNSVVHLALNSLAEKGLISIVKEGKKNIYQASNPKHFLDFIDDKRDRFESILPELLNKQNTSKGKAEVVLFRGIRGVKELLYELLESPSKEHHTLNSSKKSVMLGDTWWINYHKKRASRGIQAKLIFNESLREWTMSGAGKEYKKMEVKFTGKGFEPLTETIIRGEIMGLIIWTDEPIGILIKQKEVAESYDKYFEIMWGLAGK
tara:strand:- start:1586 stop:2317 length:732 start_codon:yes stop_codon:yes gene_type:complete